MKCVCCDKIIQYNPGDEFIAVSTFEIVCGEASFYPMEIRKIIVCSLKCLEKMVTE
jgi:hypothetical protein